MASTILGQILENVQRGVTLPGTRHATDSVEEQQAAPEVLYLEQTLLSELTLELKQLESELRQHPSVLAANLRDPGVRETITQILAEIVDEEIAHGYLRAVATHQASDPLTPQPSRSAVSSPE